TTNPLIQMTINPPIRFVAKELCSQCHSGKQNARQGYDGCNCSRPVLVVGAIAVLQRARQQPEKYPWLTQLLARKPFKVVAVALANKMARTAWALLAKGGTYRAPALAAAALTG